MAAPTRRPLRRLARALGGWLGLALGSFMLAAWIGSSVPRNREWRPPERGGVTILVESNGIHTALVLPLVTPAKDWRPRFPASHLRASRRAYTHVSISWGEREVFLNTPTWRDLSPMTALRVVGLGGEGLLHVAHYVRPAPARSVRALRLRDGEYTALVASLEREIGPARPLPRYPGYGPFDVFYETGGRYTISRTCNQWTADRLADAGVRTAWWSPFAGGVMKWVPEARLDRENLDPGG